MDEFVRNHQKIVVDTTLDSLKKHGFDAHFFATKQEVANFIMEAAADCKSVGIAGTHTVRALGIVPMLENAGKTLYDHWQLKPGTAEELQCRKNQMLSDLFLTSANAVTTTGEIVNREGCGNRTNAMTFGPGRVILVVGRNKIVSDLDAAINRIDEVAGPIRAMSLGRKTPCVVTGHCMDCDSPERICRITSVIHRQPIFTKISVVILDEDLGY
ncbi:MAG TPA: lactate utilization protein [Desulfomonilaceae bacterium]|nr:lactate utilization protein [Desulfomonilaceae bacterium]